MRDFLDNLLENIIIMDKNKKITFINRELKMQMGYDKEEEVLTKDINSLINVDNNNVRITCKNNKIIKAKCNIKNLGLSEKDYYVGNIYWDEDRISQLKCVEKFVDSLEEYICIKNIDGKHIYVNKSCAKNYGSSKEEAKIIMDRVAINSEYRDIIFKNNDYVEKTKNSCLYEDCIKIDGRKENFEIMKYPIINDLGDVDFIATVLKEVTFSKSVQLQALKSLKILENRKANKTDIEIYKKDLFNGLKDIFKHYFKTELFNIWEYNEKNKGLVPYFLYNELESILGKRESIDISEKNVKKFIEGKYEKIIKCNPNKFLNVNISNDSKEYYIVRYPIVYNNEFLGILNINYEYYPIAKVLENDLIKSVSYQIYLIIKYVKFSKMLEEEIEINEKNKNELEEFLKVATDFVAKTDIKGNFISVSSGGMDSLGWSREEILNMNWKDIVHPDDIKNTFEFIERFKKLPYKREKLYHTNRVRCIDGSYRWIQWGKGVYKKDEGYMLASGRDITREKELELKETLVEKSIELEQVRNEFFANLSHEFKTPITLIMAGVQVIEKYIERFDSKEYKEDLGRYLNILRQNSYRLLRLVTNLIDATKIDAGFYKIQKKNNNIVEVVEDIVMSVVSYCEGKHIKLVFNTEIEEEIIACDADQIERVILNLLSNAIKFTNEDGQVYIDISIEEKNVLVKVVDSGVGIAKEKIDFIFDRFIQADNLMTRKCEGSGIGLSLVKSIVELHDGTIDANSIEGVGTTFEIRLPRKKLDREVDVVGENFEYRHSKLERCSIEFSDIYSL